MVKFQNRLFCAVISIVLAAVLLLVAVPWYSMHTYGKVFVVCASRSITKGDEITEKSVKLVKMGDLNLPEGVVLDPRNAVGKKAVVDIVKGDILMDLKLENPVEEGEN